MALVRVLLWQEYVGKESEADHRLRALKEAYPDAIGGRKIRQKGGRKAGGNTPPNRRWLVQYLMPDLEPDKRPPGTSARLHIDEAELKKYAW